MTDSFEKLNAQLQSPDVRQRSEAVFALQPGRTDDNRAIMALVNVVCTDTNLNVVEDATWVLGRYGAQAIPSLLGEASHESPRARHNIIHALGKIGDVTALDALVHATHDTDSSVRLKAVYALGQIGNAQAIDALIISLGDPIQDVQWTAREILEGFGQQAIAGLVTALKTESAQVRELSVGLLGDIGDASTVQPLIDALETDDWSVRFAIVEALGKLGDNRALPVFERLLNDPDSRVRAMVKVTSDKVQTAQIRQG